jgi:polysaccharide biosynthesis transport protein
MSMTYRNEAAVQRTNSVTFAGSEHHSTLKDHKRIITKYWRFIAAVSLLSVTVTTILVFVIMTRVYTATTTLLLHRESLKILSLSTDTLSQLPDTMHDFYRTQYEILASRELAARVIRQLDLKHEPPLEKYLSRGSWASFTKWFGELWEGPSGSRGKLLGVEAKLIDKYEKMLGIEPVLETQLVKIAFTSPDPDLSARVANMHAKMFVEEGLQLRAQLSTEGERFLRGELDQLQSRLETSERKLNEYRRAHGIVENLEQLGDSSDQANIAVARMADLSHLLTQVTADRIKLAAEVSLIRSGHYDSIPAVVNDAHIQKLKEEISISQSRLSSILAQFSAHYPKAIELTAEADELSTELKTDVQTTVLGIRNSYEVATERERRLQQQLDAQKEKVLELHDERVKDALLVRDVDTNRQLYDSVVQRIKELGISAQDSTSNVSIVEPAVSPTRPSSPRIFLSLVTTATVAPILACCLAFLFGTMSHRLETSEDIESYLEYPSLVVIPDGAVVRLPTPSPEIQVVNETSSPSLIDGPAAGTSHHVALTEAYRALHAAILLSYVPPPKTILFTSAESAEGKTTTLLNTAFAFAEAGARILVVDADLRHPNCHRVLDVGCSTGLTDLLAERLLPNDVIRPVGGQRFFLLQAGSKVANPPAVLSSDRLHILFKSLRDTFDFIMVDSPPLSPFSDGLHLAGAVDGVVMVVDSQKSSREAVKRCCERLTRMRANVLGVALNRGLVVSDALYYPIQNKNSDRSLN